MGFAARQGSPPMPWTCAIQGVEQPVSDQVYRDAIEIAEAVIQWRHISYPQSSGRGNRRTGEDQVDSLFPEVRDKSPEGCHAFAPCLEAAICTE